MSFQAYLTAIERTTGRSPADFRRLAGQQGFIQGGTIAPGIKAGHVTDGLKADYGLGHGHAMALYALLKGVKKESDA